MAIFTPSQLHYRTSFDIVPSKENENAWSDLIKEVRTWMNGKTSKEENVYGNWFYKGNLGKPEIFSSGLKITTASNIGSGSENIPEFWAVQLEESCKEYPGTRKWKTDIGVTILENGKLEFSLIVSYSIRAGYIGEDPPVPVPTTPNIVSRLLSSQKWNAFAGDMQLSCYPITLQSGDVPAFVDSLKSNSRKCPIVYISCGYYSNEALVDANTMANVLAGNAIVYLAESNILDKEIEYFLPEKFRCWNGMIRIYQPKINFVSQYDYHRHRYFKDFEIEQYTPNGVIRMLVKAISRRSIQWKMPEITTINDIVSKYRIEKIKQLSVSKEKITTERWMEEINNLSAVNIELGNINSKLEYENLYLEEKNEEIESELNRQKYDKKKLIEKADNASKSLALLESKIETFSMLQKFPKDLLEVINYIENIHPEHIVFTQQAKKTAKKSSWVPVENAWPCLWSMATVLYSLFFEETEKQIDIENEFNKRTGYELAMTEGKQTKRDARLQRLREIDYQGEKINIAPHVKYGNKKPKLLRVYFCPHRKSKKIIIGHCGGHLENYSSQSKK